MVCGFVWLFLLDIKIENGQKKMFGGSLADYHFKRKWLKPGFR